MRHFMILMLVACGGKDTTGTDTGPTTSTTTTNTTNNGNGDDLSGYWVISNLTFAEGGTLTDGVDFMQTLVFTPDGADGYGVASVNADLQDGLLSRALETDDFPVTIDGDLLLADFGGTIQVFSVRAEGDDMIWEWMPDDPRDEETGVETPSEIVMAPFPEPAAMGEWTAATMSVGTEQGVFGDCEQIESRLWRTHSVNVAIGRDGVFSMSSLEEEFTDADCLQSSGSDVYTAEGMWREDGASAGMWLWDEDDQSNWDRVSFSVDGDELTLTQEECLPMPDCVDEGFGSIVFTR